MIASECLAATSDWTSARAPLALRFAMRGLPTVGGWQPAGLGHAYRVTEPHTALCGEGLKGFHHWSDGFLTCTFQRCDECLRIVNNL